MNPLWTRLLSQQHLLIGGQLELMSGLAINRGKILGVEHSPDLGHARFKFAWLAHKHGPESMPHWVALAAGLQYQVELSWSIRMISDAEYHFSIPDDGSGTFFLATSPHLLKEHEILDIEGLIALS